MNNTEKRRIEEFIGSVEGSIAQILDSLNTLRKKTDSDVDYVHISRIKKREKVEDEK